MESLSLICILVKTHDSVITNVTLAMSILLCDPDRSFLEIQILNFVIVTKGRKMTLFLTQN